MVKFLLYGCSDVKACIIPELYELSEFLIYMLPYIYEANTYGKVLLIVQRYFIGQNEYLASLTSSMILR